MPFNIALTGIRAASVDLEVTGNNIANASTTGFKRSRAEFGDLYANSFLSLGTNPVGDGVRVQKVRQEFAQGNLSFTENGLDLAINGEGFFILDTNNGDRRYSRAGAFGIDKEGNVVNSSGMHLQGFVANDSGVVSGVLGDLVIDDTSLAPDRTTRVDANLNLDASEPVLLERGDSLTSDGLLIGQAVDATAAGTNGANGYAAQTITVTQADGSTSTVTIPANSSANEIAALFNNVDNIDAAASTRATITAAGFNNASGTMQVFINGVLFDGYTNLTDLGDAINSSSSLIGVRAVLDGTDLVVIDNRGNDLSFSFNGAAGDQFLVQGDDAAATSQTLSTALTDVVVGGGVNLTIQDGVTVASGTTDLFATFTGTPFVNNVFDPADENTYNHATSTTIYDSLGNSHVLTTFFVKEPQTATTPDNLWTMYALIDGQDIGDPLVTGGTPTRASYSLVFDQDGSINEVLSDDVLISNWTPLAPDGTPNGAEGPLNVADGGTLPIPDPPTSSNFFVDLGTTTQYGSAFAVNDLQQNGFTTGRLIGLDVDDGGVIFARYTNGESKVLGQVALANFNDIQGLAPVGETTWVETFNSGNPVIGSPGTASLGAIRSSSLEDSNVDLSEQLVGLIIAQRNYQANAKTIETANAITQTIINLR
ncbi:Flagellar hook protein FlgE [Hahella chejuensis KCTC 2396]|uniref:Flagellar hook protein FlgE n=1 Tax=Hahella chejuensis (strain KCTC 2396) TaxID=349521 RepID=Q2SDU1_HAHCH|nr:flagellar hook protein FlgE [Hahella chejuensis]ABC31183.1 Flagellar hook protein FlgE [Hahella chejuensis KCTC 2396]